jgi:predicted lipid-binding transport protein (Tim44 family)
MLLALEIWLTVKAWKNGWKALALLPGALAFVMGLAIGASAGRSDAGSVLVLGLMLDFTTIAVLGFLCSKAPRSAAQREQQAAVAGAPASVPAEVSVNPRQV